ncbi:MAG: M20/M25/M40 family metallo-hydrolase [Ruminococcaceae bacterium]|nr:M20/M25/M40 family metallo-hydrolase [Oscillospiraceae bacterium]
MCERKETELEALLLHELDQRQDELYQLLSRLIKFDTQNSISDGKEKECAAYMYQLYRDLGLEADLYYPDDLPGLTSHPDYLPGRNTAHRPNANGLWHGSDPGLPRGGAVMLAAHTDTMPVGDREKWTVDPFGGLIEHGRIIGLGAGDNKSGLAAAYMAVKILKENNIQLKRSVHLTAYCDEEYGGGNGTLAACLKYPSETCVNLDGGNYELWTIALGGGGFRIALHKTTTTDSMLDLYLAVNALMEKLQQFAARRRQELHQIPLYTGSDMERSAFRLTHFAFSQISFNDASLGFVIYTDKDREIIVSELTAMLEELEPCFDRYQVVTEGFQPTTRFFHYCQTDKGNGAAETMRQAASETAGRKVIEKGSCLTDLNLFIKYGSPHSFNFGILRDFALPGGAHQPNEYVLCSEFLAYTKALVLFLLRYCGVEQE